MTFAVPAVSYDRFMGRFSTQLAPRFADFAGLAEGVRATDARVLDVGCGPGALTGELARRLGAGRVAAIDPTPHFAAACAERIPGADVREGPAEALPWHDGSFGASLAQLVVSFMSDAPAGVAEMRRVTEPGGTVAFAMWGEDEALEVAHVFWQAARVIDPEAGCEDRGLRYRTEAALRELATGAGLGNVETAQLRVDGAYSGFDEWWESICGSAGPVGGYCARLGEEQLATVREEGRRVLGDPQGPFRLAATAWALRGTA